MTAHAPRILLVEDDATAVARNRALLERDGFLVESRAGGADIVAAVRELAPWVVLVRHDPPRVSALGVCAALKSDSDTSHVSVLIEGPADADAGFIVGALEAGAGAVLPSRCDEQVLLANLYAQLNVCQVVMELREKNQFLRDLAQRDPMTGLFNHAYIHEILDREITRATGRTRAPVSLLLIDLDRFKVVNDAHGHQAGDYVLKTAAEVLRSHARKADSLARYGGDEFALVLPDTSKDIARQIAEAIRVGVETRGFAERRLPGVTLSIGVATFPQDGEDGSAILAAADRALYAAKRIGRNRVVSYDPHLGHGDDAHPAASGAEIERLLAIESVIQQRMAAFVYQPIVESETGRIYAHEALCRTRHPAFPHAGTLFDTAERAGRVVELGRILRTLSTAPLVDLDAPTLLFLNLHPFELCEELLTEATTVHRRWANRIVFEVTESSQIHDYDRRRAIISTLQQEGFRVAVDDLGAGYSGLNSLALLRPDIVKLDMALIRGVESGTSVARLIKHILDFARGEGMLVVAEGIETPDEGKVVLDLGVPLLQGYLYAKPGPAFPTARQPQSLLP